MNIIFVSTEFVTKTRPCTGLPNYLYRAAGALQRSGHHVIVVSLGECGEHTFYDGIELYRIPVEINTTSHPTLDYLHYALRNSWNLNKKVRFLIRKEKIDIIQYTSLGGIALFYPGRVPAVMRLSSYAKISYGFSHSFPAGYIRAMAKTELLSSRRMKGIYSPSCVMARGFAKDAHRKVAIIETMFYNDVKQMNYSIYEAQLRYKKYILYFGSLYEEKGVFVIADILERLLLENKELYFVFAGSPKIINGRDPIREIREKAGQAADRVIFLKALTHDRLYPIIEKAYLVTLPSLMENLSNAAIEAMYLGSILVATDGASYEQLITEGVSGFLTRPGNAASLYSGINRALHLAPEERDCISSNARARIRKLHPDIMVKRLIHYYEYIIHQCR